MLDNLFALIDCNNFYVSCERVFNPTLENKPVVVLSNNDGCIISRSNEAKELGIPMGAPFFKWKNFCKANKVAVFSSNYALYGDMSRRMMTILREDCFHLEVYSIDEAFLLLPPEPDLFTRLQLVQKKIKNYLGLPISIGIGNTKTLAKIANHLAKTQTASSIFNLSDHSYTAIFSSFPVRKIWGIGRQLATRLENLNITTALALYAADPNYIRLHFSVVVEKIVRELRGVSCLSLESIQPRKQIITSRSFGKSVTALTELEEAISHYAAIATEKLRKQSCVASAMYIFIQTTIFTAEGNRYAMGATVSFPQAIADTSTIIRLAKKAVKKLYKHHYHYQKAGIILLDISPVSLKQYDMLEDENNKSEKIMQVIDKINQLQGKNTIYYCAQGTSRDWQMRCDKRSPRYTTHWQELLKVSII